MNRTPRSSFRPSPESVGLLRREQSAAFLLMGAVGADVPALWSYGVRGLINRKYPRGAASDITASLPINKRTVAAHLQKRNGHFSSVTSQDCTCQKGLWHA